VIEPSRARFNATGVLMTSEGTMSGAKAQA
jgi:hypothetical protein